MTSAAFQLKTERGYDFFEVSSALQKEIRRGNEESALYWAFELCPRYEFYLWRRLVTIVNEDVGVGDPGLIAVVQTLRANFEEFRGRGDMAATMCLANAVVLMCRAKKSRIGCHLAVSMEQIYAREKESGQKRPIPDYALDMHTNRGRAMKRGWDHFKKEGTKLENKAGLEKEDEYEKMCYDLLKEERKYRWPKAKGAEEKPGTERTLFGDAE